MKKLFRAHRERTWDEAFLLQIRKCIKQKKHCLTVWKIEVEQFEILMSQEYGVQIH